MRTMRAISKKRKEAPPLEGGLVQDLERRQPHGRRRLGREQELMLGPWGNGDDDDATLLRYQSWHEDGALPRLPMTNAGIAYGHADLEDAKDTGRANSSFGRHMSAVRQAHLTAVASSLKVMRSNAEAGASRVAKDSTSTITIAPLGESATDAANIALTESNGASTKGGESGSSGADLGGMDGMGSGDGAGDGNRNGGPGNGSGIDAVVLREDDSGESSSSDSDENSDDAGDENKAKGWTRTGKSSRRRNRRVIEFGGDGDVTVVEEVDGTDKDESRAGRSGKARRDRGSGGRESSGGAGDSSSESSASSLVASS